MALLDITDDSFREIYQENDMVVLDFWAAWCGPCQNFKPVFEEVSKSYDDVIFGKVDTENNQKLPAYFGIRSIPTVIVIREQLEVYRGSGLSEKDLRDLVDQIKLANMDEVRKKLGEDQPPE